MFDRMKREIFYYLGFVAAGIAFLMRYIISILQHTPFNDFKHISAWEGWVYAFCVIWFCVALWNLTRTRCRVCQSPDFRLMSREEMDRWMGTERVYERVGDRSHAYRTVPVTKLEMKYTYRCTDCDHTWSITREEAKH